MKLERKPLAQVNNQAIKALVKELGSADTIRFLNQYTNGHGNYTVEREALFAGVTLDQIFHEMTPPDPHEGP